MTSSSEPVSPPPRKGIGGLLESSQPRRRSFLDYRRFIQGHYDGLPGALTAVTGFLTGHEALAGRLIRPGAFDVRGCKRILDAACGNGRYSRFLLRHADPDAVLTTFDLSPRMLQRARARLRSDRVSHAVADLTRLPYADGSFDAVVCGWVLEHLPDPRPGLRELARVLAPGGQAAPAVDRGHADGRDVQPAVALPDVQPRRATEGVRRVRPEVGEGTVVLAAAPPVQAGRHHRRAAARAACGLAQWAQPAAPARALAGAAG